MGEGREARGVQCKRGVCVLVLSCLLTGKKQERRIWRNRGWGSNGEGREARGVQCERGVCVLVLSCLLTGKKHERRGEFGDHACGLPDKLS